MHNIHRQIHHGKRIFPKDIFALPRSIRKISLIFLIYMFGWGIVTPFTQIYFKQILGSYTSLGIIYFLWHFVSVLWCMPFGEFIDKVSKKWMLLLVLLGYMILGPWFMILNGFLAILMLRIYHGVLMSSLWTTADAYIREHSPKKKTAESIGFFDSAYSLGLMLGCFIGGYFLVKFGFRFFWSVTIFALIAFFFTLFLPDRKTKPNFIKGFKDLTKTNFLTTEFNDFISNKELVKLSWLSFLLLMSIAIVNMLLPLFVYELDNNYILIGFIVGAYHLPKVFESFFSRVADKNSKRSMILLGATYSIAFFLLVFFTNSVVVLFILAFFISLAFALIAPSIEGAATTIIPRNKIGELSGVLRTIKMGAMGIGPMIGGFISDIFGIKYVFLFGAFMMVILLISAFFIKEYRVGEEEELVLSSDRK